MYPGPSTFQAVHSNFTLGPMILTWDVPLKKFEDPDAHLRVHGPIWESGKSLRTLDALYSYVIILLSGYLSSLNFSLKSDIFSSLTVQLPALFYHICRYSRPLPH
jgi:hypothetical protein